MKFEVKPGAFSKAEQYKVGWTAPITLGLLALVALVVFGFLGNSVATSIMWNDIRSDGAIPNLVVPANLVGYSFGIGLVILAGLAFWFVAFRNQKVPIWLLLVFGLLFISTLVVWVASNGQIPQVPVIWLLTGALALATPVIFGTLAGIFSERSGVVNIAIEGQLLSGAFAAAVVASVTKNFWAALIAAMLAGALTSLILALFAIVYLVDQIIVGVVLNLLVISLTNYLYSAFLNDNAQELNYPGTLPFIQIPFLADIPVLGPLLFDNRITTYLVFLLVPLSYIFLFKTKWGLRLRAVGEHPLAADTVGINVNRIRFWGVMIGGLLAGIGGAAMTIGNVGPFVKEMANGQGYIALAAVILGRWNPWLAAAGALLFGFASNFKVWTAQTGAPIPADLISMIPYLVTLLAVIGLVGKVTGPAASGKPYIKS